jgi:hypothetical protein
MIEGAGVNRPFGLDFDLDRLLLCLLAHLLETLQAVLQVSK